MDSKDISDNLIASEQSMRNLIATYEKALGLYETELDAVKLIAETQYAGYLDFIGDDILQINYDAITGLNEDTQKAIEDLVDMYETATDAVNEYNNAILEQQQAIKELVREYRDYYVTLEEKNC